MGLSRNPNLYIPIEFVDRDGTVHTARDWDELAAKVIGYRERRRLDPGNPQQEITEQACRNWPDRCVDNTPRSFPETQPKLHHRILSWVGNLAGIIGSVGYVSPEEAARRADICAACPRQKAWQGGCASCRTQVNGVVRELLKGRAQSAKMKALSGCDALSEDTRLSIWVRQKPVDGPLPDACWRR